MLPTTKSNTHGPTRQTDLLPVPTGRYRLTKPTIHSTQKPTELSANTNPGNSLFFVYIFFLSSKANNVKGVKQSHSTCMITGNVCRTSPCTVITATKRRLTQPWRRSSARDQSKNTSHSEGRVIETVTDWHESARAVGSARRVRVVAVML